MHTHHDRTDTAYAALAQLRADLTLLRDVTDRVHRPTTSGPTPQQIADAGRLHTLERRGIINQLRRGLTPIGASTAPADLTVLDTIRDTELDLADLEAAIIDRVAPSLPRASGTAAKISRIITLLPKIGAVGDLMDHLLAETRRLHRRIRYALGDAEQVHRLSARCPHCRARSLRAFMDRGMVMCVNVGCQCQDWLCSCRDDDAPTRHQWTVNEWPELAAGVELIA